MYLLACILLLSAVCLLTVSFFTSRQLIKKLPLGKVRYNWQIFSYLIVAAIIGYAVYMFLLVVGQVSITSLMIPKLAFAASTFMLLLCFLTYQITVNIRDAIAMDQASIVDPVLDIYNRRYFDRRIDEETQRSRRYDLPLSLILFEIDEFNKVIDTHGKLVGDVVLKKVSDFIVSSVRSSDIVARFDESKLIVGTTQTEEEMAVNLADRLRAEIEKLNVLPSSEKQNSKTMHVTSSVGVACVLDSISNGLELTNMAERALSQANVNGRNKVYTFDPTEPDIGNGDLEVSAA